MIARSSRFCLIAIAGSMPLSDCKLPDQAGSMRLQLSEGRAIPVFTYPSAMSVIALDTGTPHAVECLSTATTPARRYAEVVAVPGGLSFSWDRCHLDPE